MIEHEHHPDAVRARLSAGYEVSYLREWVYGGIDGAITTFAIVAGVVGADLSSRVILILGLANMIGDGFSMAAGSFTSVKTERDQYDRLRAVESRHIDQVPEGEREEVRQILAAKGFGGKDLERAVAVMTADREQWIEVMMTEEYGLAKVVRAPMRAAVATFVAFVLCGAVPLVPFLLPLPHQFAVAVAVTGVVFFAIGSFKSRWTLASWWRSGLEVLGVGYGAAGLAYGIGAAVSWFV